MSGAERRGQRAAERRTMEAGPDIKKSARVYRMKEELEREICQPEIAFYLMLIREEKKISCLMILMLHRRIYNLEIGVMGGKWWNGLLYSSVLEVKRQYSILYHVYKKYFIDAQIFFFALELLSPYIPTENTVNVGITFLSISKTGHCFIEEEIKKGSD